MWWFVCSGAMVMVEMVVLVASFAGVAASVVRVGVDESREVFLSS